MQHMHREEQFHLPALHLQGDEGDDYADDREQQNGPQVEVQRTIVSDHCTNPFRPEAKVAPRICS